MASEATPDHSIRLRDYRYPGEVLSLFLTCTVLLSLYLVAALFFPTSWSSTYKTLAVTAAGLAVYFVTVKLQQRSAFGTLVRVSPRQFPELHAVSVAASERLSASRVPVYVKRSSDMNIYTVGLWQEPLVVLTSALVDQMPLDALQFCIGREIGHMQAGHTWLSTLLKPLGTEIPVIGKLLNSVVFGDWMNRTEFTADRAGFIACGSLTTAVTTMLKFGVGIRLYEKLDIREFLEQITEVRDVRGRLFELMADQPYLTRRIRSLVRFALSEQVRPLVPAKQTHTVILKDLPPAFLKTSGVGREPQGEGKAANQVIENRPAPPESRAAGRQNSGSPPGAYFVLRPRDGSPPRVLRSLCRIGRSPDNDIVVDEDLVSRYHAEIRRQDEGFVLVDLKSLNGVRVNGARISADTLLALGDAIHIGNREFVLDVDQRR